MSQAQAEPTDEQDHETELLSTASEEQIKSFAENVKTTEVPANYHIVMDIPVTLSIELGRKRMTIQELLQLKPDSVIELQRMVDEPMDVIVNGTLIAHGEVVVIDDRFALRLTDVVDPIQRLKRFT